MGKFRRMSIAGSDSTHTVPRYTIPILSHGIGKLMIDCILKNHGVSPGEFSAGLLIFFPIYRNQTKISSRLFHIPWLYTRKWQMMFYDISSLCVTEDFNSRSTICWWVCVYNFPYEWIRFPYVFTSMCIIIICMYHYYYYYYYYLFLNVVFLPAVTF